MLLVDERDRQQMFLVPPPGEVARIAGRRYTSEELCALHDGELLVTPERKRYLVFRPTQGQVVMNMPRQAQVIYPKDQAIIVGYGDIAPGQTVVEVGCGHGATTMTLLRALGPTGRLVTMDIRLDHLNRTRKNIAAYLGPEFLGRWEPRLGDPSEAGFGGLTAERLVSDVPEPWSLADAAVELLPPGGLWLAYIPGVLQMMQLVEAIKAHRELCLPEAFETLQRYWHIQPPSVRPKHAMKAHTGFIVTCRRRWRAPQV